MAPGSIRGRRVVWVWLGTGVAWCAVVAAEVMLLDELPVRIVAATTLVALVVGALATWRVRSRDAETFISVKDLRRR